MDMENLNGGKKYEVRSNSNGSFDITDRTSAITRYSIDSSGNHNFTGSSIINGDLSITGTTTGITQSMIPGLESALNSKQSTISLEDGIQNFIYPQGPLYFQTVYPPVGFMGMNVQRTGLFLNMTNLYTKAEVDNLTKPLICGEIRPQTPSSNFSVGRIGFSFARTTTATAGQYTITFASPLPNANYVVHFTNIAVGQFYYWVMQIITKTNQGFTLECKRTDQSWQDNPFSFVIFN